MPFQPPLPESAKQRSLRVPLDHFQRPGPLTRTKLLLAWIAAAIGGAYIAWLLANPWAGGRHASPGPLANAHATLDQDCWACHLDFSPLRADALHLTALLRPATANDGKRPQSVQEAHRLVADAACQKCHAGP